MKKLLIGLGLLSSAALSMAIDGVASYQGDAYIYGVTTMANSGTINVQWSGYEAPYYGRTAFRVVIWDSQVSYPIVNDLVMASGDLNNYSRNYNVAPGHVVRVELYAAANQYANDRNISHDVVTRMWVEPLAGWPTNYTMYTPGINQAQVNRLVPGSFVYLY